MILICRAFRDPLTQQLNFATGKFVVTGIGWRHAQRLTIGCYSAEQFGFVWISGDNRKAALTQIGLSGRLYVQAHLGFAVAGIGTMTGKAAVGKNGTDLAIELNSEQGEGEGEQ